MRFLYLFILVFFAGFVQASFGLNIYIFRLDILLLLVAYASRYIELEETIIMGAISGLLMDVFEPQFLGAGIIARASSAYFFAIFYHLLLIEKPLQSGLGISAGSLISSIIYTLLTPYRSNFPYILFARIIPQAIFMFLVGYIFFLLKRIEFKISKGYYVS
jgi:cell shape-determining protein MreD